MDIGITTFHNAHNYGAMLQAYGLQEAIRSLGFSPRFVDLHTSGMDNQNRRKVPIRGPKDLLKRLVVVANRRRLEDRYRNFEAFKEKHLCLGKRYHTSEELRAHPPAFERFVCGSDQIWNVQQGVSPHFFLDYVPATARKISYAPSFGVEEIPQCHEGAIRKLLEGFSSISVRERSGAGIVEKITGRPPKVVLDPVFLPPREKWNEVMVTPSMNEPYLVFYSLETDKILSSLVSLAGRSMKMPVVVLGKPGSYIFRTRCMVRIDSGPSEFLGWIANASALITNSFHATAFSIIFGIPFATYPHSTRNTRIEHILDIAGMRGRLLGHGTDDRALLMELLTRPAHHGSFPAELEREKASSLDFLRESLE